MEKRETKEMMKYGVRVIADVEIEATRAAGCLCLRCVRMVTEEDVEDLVERQKIQDDTGRVIRTSEEIRDIQAEWARHVMTLVRAFNCPTAQRLYDACIDGDVATPVTRCPMFVEKAVS